MSAKKQEFIDMVYNLFLNSPNPVGSTWYWHKKVFGKGYDRPEGYQYRKLLMALNILHNSKKIKAIRTNDATVWALPYKDYRTCQQEV